MRRQERLPFSWSDVGTLPDVERLARLFDVLPDGEIVAALEARRGSGRDDYPVRPMWRSLIARIVLGHDSMESLVRELNRNPALLEVCGFDPLPRQKTPPSRLETDPDTGRQRVRWDTSPTSSTIPHAWNLSRFLKRVRVQERDKGLITDMMARLPREMVEHLPDMTRRLQRATRWLQGDDPLQ